MSRALRFLVFVLVFVIVFSGCDEKTDRSPAIEPSVTNAPETGTVTCPGSTRLVDKTAGGMRQQSCVLDNDGGGVRHGPLRVSDEQGRKVMEATYDRGMQVGTVTFWSPDGQKDSEGPMNAKGEKHGHWKEWKFDPASHSPATLEGEYVENVKEGEWTTVIGNERVVGPFKKGRADGLFSTFDVALTLKKGETLMKNGEIIWTTAWNPASGATVKKCFFKAGVEERCETYLDPAVGSPTKSECDGVFRAEKPKMDRCTAGCPRGDRFPACQDGCAAKRSPVYVTCFRELMGQ